MKFIYENTVHVQVHFGISNTRSRKKKRSIGRAYTPSM